MNEGSLINGFIDPILKAAEKLGGLTPAAIFAFMWLVQYVKEIKRESRDSDLKKKENERREQQVISTERNTEAYRAMAVNILMLRDAHNATMLQVKELYILVQERIPPHGH